jgi:EamA domain-containing membrane protein RarD
MVAASMEMIGASVLFGILAVVTGELRNLEVAAIDGAALAAFIYLVTAGSMIAFGAYRWLVLNAPPTLVGTHAYVNPVVAVALGWLVLGERLNGRMIVAGAIVLCSLVLVVTGRPGVPIPAQATSGGDVYAGVRRWQRIRSASRRVGKVPAAALRVGMAPVARGYRSVRTVRDARMVHQQARRRRARPEDTA